jgi:Plasmid recombination enzyme.
MFFSCDIRKLNKENASKIIVHNTRSGSKPTSQLESADWFAPVPKFTFVELDKDRIKLAKSLPKRKDAVVLFSVVVQIGDQKDWRKSDGSPIQSRELELKLMEAGKELKEWAKDFFGAKNVVSLELHLDESSPHFHLLCTPITEDNELQAKKWLNAKGSLMRMRKTCYQAVSRGFECDYSSEVPAGGDPFDDSKSLKTRRLIDELQKAQARIAELEQENAVLKEKLSPPEPPKRYIPPRFSNNFS